MAKITLSMEFCVFFIIEEAKVTIIEITSVPAIPAIISAAINFLGEAILYLINVPFSKWRECVGIGPTADLIRACQWV